jgi:hypothetical protein
MQDRIILSASEQARRPKEKDCRDFVCLFTMKHTKRAYSTQQCVKKAVPEWWQCEKAECRFTGRNDGGGGGVRVLCIGELEEMQTVEQSLNQRSVKREREREREREGALGNGVCSV